MNTRELKLKHSRSDSITTTMLANNTFGSESAIDVNYRG